MNLPLKTPWNRAVNVTAIEQYRLRVQMDDGRVMTLDLAPLICRHDAYWRLRQNRYFRMVSIDPIGGICWPEGEDLAPDGLERYHQECPRT
ncbi:MAG: DUF2442 domain-containing protein [Desulfobacteraceae bacterium]|nr:MAG: DUF2442 domain-containing protein [Desulfobacteraceae bacterium]